MYSAKMERVSASERKVQMVVSADKVDEAFAGAAEEVGRLMQRPLGEKQLGSDPEMKKRNAVATRATRRIVEDACREFVSEQGLRLTANPSIDVAVLAEKGKEFSFVAMLTVVPEYTLKDYSNLSVPVVKDLEVRDEDIYEHLRMVQQRCAEETPHSEDPIGNDDVATITFTNYIDGKGYENNVVHDYPYMLGSLELPAAFEEGLIGLRSGEDSVIEFVVPVDFPNEEIAGKLARFDVHVDDVMKRELPEIDDKFAQSLLYADLEAWKEKLRGSIAVEKQGRYEEARENGARQALAELLEGEVDDAIALTQSYRMLEAFKLNLMQQEISFEEYCSALRLTEEGIRREMENEARVTLRENLALESLFRDQGMSLNDSDLIVTMNEIESGDVTPTPLFDLDDDQKSAVREMTMHRMATEWLLNNVHFYDPNEK